MGSRHFWIDGNHAWERAINQQWEKEQMEEDAYVNRDNGETMTNKKYPRLNSEGLALLKQWIEDKSCLDEAGSLHSVDANNLNAWANEAEESVLNGNLPMVEMQSISTRSGLTETLTLPRHCIEWIDMN